MIDVEEHWTADVEGDSLQSRLIFLKQKAAYRIACGYAKGTTALDIGCGSGYGAALLSLWADAVVGVDENEQVLDYCNDRYGKVRNLKFQNDTTGAFGLVTCFQVLEHVPEPERFVESLYLRARGTLIITTPNAGRRWLRPGQKPWNDEHVKEYREDDLRALLDDVCEHVEIAGIHGSPDADILERMRTAGADGIRLALRRGKAVFTDADFTMGPAEGALDLIAVCR